jgi:hypothetical protein
MFHLYQPDHIEWPVSVDLPAKGGTKKAYTFTAHFNVLSQDDCQKLAGSAQPDAGDHAPPA